MIPFLLECRFRSVTLHFNPIYLQSRYPASTKGWKPPGNRESPWHSGYHAWLWLSSRQIQTPVVPLHDFWTNTIEEKYKPHYLLSSSSITIIVLPGSCHIDTAVWMHYMMLTKRLEKKLDSNYTRMLWAILNKSWWQHPTRHQLYAHLPPITKTIQVRRTRYAGHCWKSRDELISDILLWTLTYGRAKAGRPARTYIQQLCEDTDVALKTYQRRWTIGKSGERGSGISVLVVGQDEMMTRIVLALNSPKRVCIPLNKEIKNQTKPNQNIGIAI